MTASGFDPDLAERLRALDLTQVAISAAIDANGQLGQVGDLWAKLQAAAEAQARLRLLHTIIVAERQKDVPPPLEAPDAWPLRICQAATLKEAIDLLAREALPRQQPGRVLWRQVSLADCRQVCRFPRQERLDARRESPRRPASPSRR